MCLWMYKSLNKNMLHINIFTPFSALIHVPETPYTTIINKNEYNTTRPASPSTRVRTSHCSNTHVGCCQPNPKAAHRHNTSSSGSHVPTVCLNQYTCWSISSYSSSTSLSLSFCFTIFHSLITGYILFAKFFITRSILKMRLRTNRFSCLIVYRLTYD